MTHSTDGSTFCDENVCSEIEWWNIRYPLFTGTVRIHSRSPPKINAKIVPTQQVEVWKFLNNKSQMAVVDRCSVIQSAQFRSTGKHTAWTELGNDKSSNNNNNNNKRPNKREKIESGERKRTRVYQTHQTIDAHFICIRCVCVPKSELEIKTNNELFDVHFFPPAPLCCEPFVVKRERTERNGLFFSSPFCS